MPRVKERRLHLFQFGLIILGGKEGLKKGFSKCTFSLVFRDFLSTSLKTLWSVFFRPLRKIIGAIRLFLSLDIDE